MLLIKSHVKYHPFSKRKRAYKPLYIYMESAYFNEKLMTHNYYVPIKLTPLNDSIL